MSLKNVELQVALPRTQEIVRPQELQQHKTMHEQLLSIAERAQIDQQRRQSPVDVNESEKNHIRDEQKKEKRQKRKQTESSKKQGNTSGNQVSDHLLMHDPLRGRHIDILL